MVSRVQRGLKDAIQKLSTPDAVTWIEEEFFIPETKNDPVLKGRIGLQLYQKDVIREALSTDKRGLFKYSIILYSDVKKSAKSSIAAAVNLFRAHHTDWGEFYIIANDLKQADSRVAHYLRRAITLNPRLRELYHARGYRMSGPSNSFIEAIPIDPSGEAGSNADQVTISEMWGANEQAKQRMFSEMTISPTKHGRSFRWIETYAGYTEESELLYSLYELGVKKGELLWPDRMYPVTGGTEAPLELYVNREARMLCLWNTQPRCPWQTPEYYASESQVLLPNEFARIHRNQWVSSTETFVPMEWYDACIRREDEWPQWQPRPEKVAAYERPFTMEQWPVIITLDAGVSGAEFGLYMGCRHPLFANEILTLYAQRWKPGLNGKIDYYGAEEKPGPEIVLKRLTKMYNVVEVAYDEFQLHSFCSKLKVELGVVFKTFPQGSERLIGDSLLRDMIRDRRFWHRGEVDLREHIQNANAKIDPEDRRIRIVQRVERLHIDLAVCAAMCARELTRLNL